MDETTFSADLSKSEHSLSHIDIQGINILNSERALADRLH